MNAVKSPEVSSRKQDAIKTNRRAVLITELCDGQKGTSFIFLRYLLPG